ncbi:MAG: hypothetical protein R3F62_31635 [Planctomycetota bacterium]
MPTFPRRAWRWARARWRALALATAAAVLALNALAYRHAGAFVHYRRGGVSSAAPEALGPWGRVRTLLGGVEVARPENRRDPGALGLAFSVHVLPEEPRLEVWRVPAEGARGVALLVPGYAARR